MCFTCEEVKWLLFKIVIIKNALFESFMNVTKLFKTTPSLLRLMKNEFSNNTILPPRNYVYSKHFGLYILTKDLTAKVKQHLVKVNFCSQVFGQYVQAKMFWVDVVPGWKIYVLAKMFWVDVVPGWKIIDQRLGCKS